jgi:DNA mismatch repair protein MutL
MANIAVLDQNTINKIAAGEVIERPASVVKELVENSIDAGASAVTVEIKEGGISFIRITDNGSGIEKSEVPLAFLRHSTSKIKSVEDLLTVSSLGFRGEALSSIASVSQVELISKTSDAVTGVRYVIEGGTEKYIEEVGAPEGTTFLVRNLFFNTPARKKFLKSPVTEAGYIGDLVERLALSHPNISFKFINNGQNKLHTSGNANLKDIIYNIYGREIASNLLAVRGECGDLKVDGYIGKPLLTRGNRNYENYYVNGRYVKSKLISKAIEDAYKNYMMLHRYPFTVLHLTIDSKLLDVNVHPAKMELRFKNNEEIYNQIQQLLKDVLAGKELIPKVVLNEETKIKKEEKVSIPEPFEIHRKQLEQTKKSVSSLEDVVSRAETLMQNELRERTEPLGLKETAFEYGKTGKKEGISGSKTEPVSLKGQISLFEDRFLSEKAKIKHKLIGQIFDTYWLVQYEDKLFIIDQHAAHEKVLYEKTIRSLKDREYTSQMCNPPIVLTLSMREEEVLKKYYSVFQKIGFEIEHFGGREYAVREVPDNLFSIAKKELLTEMIDGLVEEDHNLRPDIIEEKIASLSCKAAVKGNNRLSAAEMEKLIEELLSLENPYNCPHGRPTIISMTKYELEKKFKRIV